MHEMRGDMVSVQIEEIKEFMNGLFAGEIFDAFEVSEVEVKTLFTSKLSGRVNSEWLDTDEEIGEYVLWKQIKSRVYDLIKGKKTPLLFAVCFFHKKENGDRGLLRIQFEGEKLRLITGYSTADFSLDKTPQIAWDENFLGFLKKHGIIYEEETYC